MTRNAFSQSQERTDRFEELMIFLLCLWASIEERRYSNVGYGQMFVSL